jgi:hypothetical protein
MAIRVDDFLLPSCNKVLQNNKKCTIRYELSDLKKVGCWVM